MAAQTKTIEFRERQYLTPQRLGLIVLIFLSILGGYLLTQYNPVMVIGIVGVTVLGYPDGEAASGYRFRIALASVAPIPLIAAEAEKILGDRPITAAVIAAAAQAAMDACSPIDDVRGSGRYRKHMVRNLAQRGVTEVFEMISGR